MNTNSLQGKRIADFLKEHPNEDFSMPTLSKIGAGNPNGFCASFTRRISDLRKQGINIIKSKDEWVDGQRQTSYKFLTP